MKSSSINSPCDIFLTKFNLTFTDVIHLFSNYRTTHTSFDNHTYNIYNEIKFDLIDLKYTKKSKKTKVLKAISTLLQSSNYTSFLYIKEF